MAWIDDMIQEWWGATPSGPGGTLEYSRGGPYAGFATEGYIDGEKVVLDPRLLEIIEVAATEFPLRVVAFSGVAGRSEGTGNHPNGLGIDVLIFDENGLPLPNFEHGPTFSSI